jgi:hypothetical protein
MSLACRATCCSPCKLLFGDSRFFFFSTGNKARHGPGSVLFAFDKLVCGAIGTLRKVLFYGMCRLGEAKASEELGYSEVDDASTTDGTSCNVLFHVLLF